LGAFSQKFSGQNHGKFSAIFNGVSSLLAARCGLQDCRPAADLDFSHGKGVEYFFHPFSSLFFLFFISFFPSLLSPPHFFLFFFSSLSLEVRFFELS